MKIYLVKNLIMTGYEIFFWNELQTNLTWKVEVVKSEIFSDENLKQFYISEGIILSLILIFYMLYKSIRW